MTPPPRSYVFPPGALKCEAFATDGKRAALGFPSAQGPSVKCRLVLERGAGGFCGTFSARPPSNGEGYALI